MSKPRALQPCLKTIDTRRIKPVYDENHQVNGSARVNLKRRIYVRDGGRCCICQRVADLHDSELDHRIALQFGGDDDKGNLWTLCTDCHSGKSSRETSINQPDSKVLRHSVPKDKSQSGIVILWSNTGGGIGGCQRRLRWTPRPFSRVGNFPLWRMLTR